MDENHQDNTESKPIATEDKQSPPPLSTKDHRGPDRPQNHRMGAIIKSLGFFGYDKDTKEYTAHGQLAKITKEHQPGKTVWDWLQLVGVLLIPLVIFLATISFNQKQADLAQQQHQQDQASALDQQRAAILQTYIDNIQDLLLNHNLLKSKQNDDVAILARARTLTALQGLDPERKGRLLTFLSEANLIGYYGDAEASGPQAAIISLSGADLSGADLSAAQLTAADLSGADLRGANLSSVNLHSATLLNANLRGATLRRAGLVKADFSGADLSGADLSGAYLTLAILSFAHLRRADFYRADLSYANFNEADLSGADLSYADLSSVHNLTQPQLDQVFTCKGTILPTGLTCYPQLSG